MACVTDILLDRSLLPARRWLAELGIEDIMGVIAVNRIHVALLVNPYLVDGILHIVIEAVARDAFKDAERMPVRIEQHLTRLQKIRPHQEGAAVKQLDVHHLQLDPLATNIGSVLASAELKCRY